MLLRQGLASVTRSGWGRHLRTSPRALSTSTPSSSSQPDALVIGAGILGCATALELQNKGFNTFVIDREAGAAHGSTSFSSGIIRTFYSLEETTKLALEGHHYFTNWGEYVESHTGNSHSCPTADFTPMPSLLVRDEGCESWIQTLIQNHDALGIPVEEWDMGKLKNELSWMDWTNYYPPRRIDDEQFGVPNEEGEIHGALVLPMSGFVSDPQLATQNIRYLAEEAGVKFLFKKCVTKIHKNDSRVEGVELEDGTVIKSRVVVNAAGPHSNKITEMAYADGQSNDMKLTTKPMRVEVAHMDVPKGVEFSKEKSGYIVGDTNLGIYLRPDVRNTLIVGGQEPPCDPLHFLEDYSQNDPSFTDEWEHHVYRANLRVPSLGVPNSSRAQGVVSAYDVTEDWVPVYDQSNIPGYFMAIGTSGNQFKNAPVVGKMMAKLVEEVEGGRDHDGGEPCWVELEKSGGGKLDLNVFSRLREIQSTTATVMG